MKIWHKHLFFKVLKTFFFFLFCLFAIYVIIDLSAHGVRFFSKASARVIVLYYLHTFSAELDLFFSLTFLLATLRVLFDLSAHREFLSLQMAGISKKRLLLPLFCFAALLTSVSYVNCQWFAPHTEESTNNFKTAYKAKKKAKVDKLYTAVFEDKSEIIYRTQENGELIDLFWVRNPSDIWHMKTLHIDTREGNFVNHLIRNQNGQFEKRESFVSKQFSEIPWENVVILSRLVPYASRPLSTLFMQALKRPADARILCSHLYYKLLSPLIPFVILIAIGPIAIRYNRTQPTFLIAALSIFVLLGFKTILDGMLILGENQVLPSYVAIFAPVLIVLSATLPVFVRMK